MAKKCPKVQKSVNTARFHSIGATNRTRRESQCLPYAGFLMQGPNFDRNYPKTVQLENEMLSLPQHVKLCRNRIRKLLATLKTPQIGKHRINRSII